MTTDIKTVAQQEYRERMKQRLAGVPLPLEILMQSEDPITERQLNVIQEAKTYENRDRIPEVLLPFSDLYNELTGQEPNRRSFTDWIDTFWLWRAEKLTEDAIRSAWAQAQSEKGFTVGRPGALTITAVGMKSKARPALPQIDKKAIERTIEDMNEKWRERKLVSAETRERLGREMKERIAKRRFENEPHTAKN